VPNFSRFFRQIFLGVPPKLGNLGDKNKLHVNCENFTAINLRSSQRSGDEKKKRKKKKIHLHETAEKYYTVFKKQSKLFFS